MEQNVTRENVVDHMGVVESGVIVPQVEDVGFESVLSDMERRRMIVWESISNSL